MIGLLPHSLITEEEIASVKTLRDGTVYMVSSPFASVRGIFWYNSPWRARPCASSIQYVAKPHH